jgi:hypothetical protein
VLVEAADLLDRQIAYLQHRQGRDFFWSLLPFLSAVQGEPLLARVFRDLVVSADQELRGVNKSRARLRHDLVKLRRQIVAAFPAIDDGQVPHALPGDPGWDAYGPSLANFDRLVAAEPVEEKWPEIRTSFERRDILIDLLELLRGKVAEADPASDRADAKPLHAACGDLGRRIEFVKQDYHLRAVSSAAVGTLRIVLLASVLNPNPKSFRPPQDMKDLFEWGLKEIRSRGRRIRKYLYGQPSETDPDVERDLIAPIRVELEVFHLEARRRLGLKQSLRGVVDRYVARCQWHHADRLSELASRRPRTKAKQKSARRDRGKPEALLTADFAGYLHDNGFSPLTEPMTARLRPDVIGFGQGVNLYVEAKQYRSSARDYLIAGVHQVWDTLGRLRGTPFEVHEAFYLVFRRGGPRYVFPRELHAEGATVYPVLVDIAPASESGSRQKQQPIELSADEMAPKKGTGESLDARGGTTKRKAGRKAAPKVRTSGDRGRSSATRTAAAIGSKRAGRKVSRTSAAKGRTHG